MTLRPTAAGISWTRRFVAAVRVIAATVAVVAAAVAPASCSNGDRQETGAGDEVASDGNGASTTEASVGSPGTTTRFGSATTTKSYAARGGATTSTARRDTAGTVPSPVPTTAPEPSPTGPEPEDDSWRGPPGSYARSLLRPSPATAITVELMVEDGASLRAATVAHLESLLESAARKPVTVTTTALGAASQTTWSTDELVAAADTKSRIRPQRGTAVLHVLAVNGEFTDSSVLGVALRGDLFAVFVDVVNDTGSPLVPASVIEEAIAAHETGHLLGLVDLVVDRNRDDPEHPFHSRNRGSVMYWAIESNLVGQVLDGPPPRDFDADDLADLAALRNGA
ncbi:MAG TPA: hypothetical protein VF230_11975 [Acidimicrobiales bacterium]